MLAENGVFVKLTHVLAVAMNDVPGGASEILHLLADNGISLEYTYACVGKVSGKALMVMRVDDSDKAEALLHERGYDAVQAEDIYRI